MMAMAVVFTARGLLQLVERMLLFIAITSCLLFQGILLFCMHTALHTHRVETRPMARAHAAAGEQALGGMIRIGKPTLHVID